MSNNCYTGRNFVEPQSVITTVVRSLRSTRSKKGIAAKRHLILKIAALASAALVLAVHAQAAGLLAATKSSSAKLPDAQVIWIVSAIIPFILIIIWLGLHADRMRAKKLEAMAQSLGFAFRLNPTKADTALADGCSLANIGHGHFVSNVLEALHTADELDLTRFYYRYSDGDGLSAGRYTYTYYLTISRMQSPLLKFPSFVLFPQTFYTKMGTMLGRTENIIFPDTPRFSKKYILGGGDEAAIRAIFTPAVRQFLEPLHLRIETPPGLFFVMRRGRPQLRPNEMKAWIEEDKPILALFFEAQRSSEPSSA
ncbi:MAG: hypothetical protein DLM73_02970 [Chthoniobacterales bacterium]|nr:MAG: hypothetical protein DLM73_02970 [Chthoniobacterales bacterium]